MWWTLLSILLANFVYCQDETCNGDPNAEAQTGCVPTCQPTCDVPIPKVCTDSCIMDGCTCKSGYILDKPSGRCIKTESCPSNLGCKGDKNAVASSCSSNCRPTCKPSDKVCTAQCKPGCVCIEGYILDKDGGKCIKKSDCDKYAS